MHLELRVGKHSESAAFVRECLVESNLPWQQQPVRHRLIQEIAPATRLFAFR
jgi:hypothetical protein